MAYGIFQALTAGHSVVAGANGQVTTVAARPQPLEASELRRMVNPASLGFKTTDELHPNTGLIGQDRALKAIQFGANIKSHDFNIFVLGPPASGKTTAVKAHLGPKAAEAPTPADWVYVYNFDNLNRPKALQLPHGRAKDLARGMVAALDELRSVLPALFESEDYQVRRRAIDEQFRSGQEEALEALNTRAQTQNIAILRTPTGFTMAPMHEGKVVKPEVFNALPETMRKEVEHKIEALQRDLEAILERMPKADKKRRADLSVLNEDVAKRAVDEALDDLMAAFSDVPQVRDYFACGRPGPDAQRRPVPHHRRGGERHRQAAGGHRAGCPLPPLHGQRDGLQRRGRHRRGAGRRGAQSHPRQHHRPRRARRPDGHVHDRLSADQARRACIGPTAATCCSMRASCCSHPSPGRP